MFSLQDMGSLHHTVQQIVDIPVPSGAQDFFPDQGSTGVSPRCRTWWRSSKTFVPRQSATALRRDGGPGGGLQNSVPEQSSPALGGADDVGDVLQRSAELLEFTPANFRFTLGRKKRRRRRRQKRWTLMWCPCAFKAISGPEDSVPATCVVVSAGGARRARLRTTRTTSSTPDVQGQW